MSPSPLRVMIDARMLIGRFSGVARFVTRLTDHLARTHGVQVVALCGAEAYEPWLDRDDIEVVPSGFAKRDRTAGRRLRWEGMQLRRLIKAANVDVFHATWNTGVPALSPVPVVLTIHDLIPWFTPAGHFATRLQQRCYRRAIRASARRATLVTTVSDYVRQQVISTLPVLRRQVRTIHNGVDLPEGEPSDIVSPGRRYVLYVGGHECRKNVAAVLRAMERFWKANGDSYELRLTGNESSLCADASAALSDVSDRSRVRFLGAVDDAELSRQYRHAHALLMLSGDEGFGLPVLEAMAHGCPVIASRCASLPEVVGDSGMLVDADDAAAVCAALDTLADASPERAALIRGGRDRARQFAWSVTASRFHDAYRDAAASAVTADRQSDVEFHAGDSVSTAVRSNPSIQPS